ncbi:hypothetical protein Bca52824_068190, partial [Brassica carinata]
MSKSFSTWFILLPPRLEYNSKHVSWGLGAADQSKSNLGSSVDDEENLHPNQSSLEKQPLPWELR